MIIGLSFLVLLKVLSILNFKSGGICQDVCKVIRTSTVTDIHDYQKNLNLKGVYKDRERGRDLIKYVNNLRLRYE